jgi:phytol kinase
MKFTLLIIISSTVIFGIEFLKRRFRLSTNITRRSTHIGTATVAGLAPLFVTQNEIILACIIFAIVLFFGRRYNIFSAIHSVERKTFGEICLPLGVAVTALLFLPQNLHAFQFGVFVMAFSDALAGLLGEKFGKRNFIIFGNKKTLEGSLTFFVCTLLLTLIFFPVFSYKIFMVPIILTIIEFCLTYGLDNLVIPIIGALLFQVFL